MEEIALVNEDKIDPETAAIGVTVQYEDLIENRRVLTLTDQESILTGEAVRRLACDAGIHRMVVQGVSEFLDIGRKTRTWTTPSAAPSAPATTTAAPPAAAAAASPTSTTSTGGKTAAKPRSTTAYHCAPTTTTSSTKADGPSPTTPTPAPPEWKVPPAKYSSHKPTSEELRRELPHGGRSVRLRGQVVTPQA